MKRLRENEARKTVLDSSDDDSLEATKLRAHVDPVSPLNVTPAVHIANEDDDADWSDEESHISEADIDAFLGAMEEEEEDSDGINDTESSDDSNPVVSTSAEGKRVARVEFVVSGFVTSDTPNVDHLIVGFLPDKHFRIDRDAFFFALAEGESSAVVNVDEEDSAYSLTGIIPLSKTKLLDSLFVSDNPSFVSSLNAESGERCDTASTISQFAEKHHCLLLVNARISCVPFEVAMKLILTACDEAKAEYVEEAKQLVRKGVIERKSVREYGIYTHICVIGKLLVRPGGGEAKQPKGTPEGLVFLRDEDRALYECRCCSAPVHLYRYAREYEDQPDNDVPFGIIFFVEACKLSEVARELYEAEHE